MALPSQFPRTPRQASSLRSSARPRGPWPGAIIVSGLVVAASLAVWWYASRENRSTAFADIPAENAVLPTTEKIDLPLTTAKTTDTSTADPRADLRSVPPPSTTPSTPRDPGSQPAEPRPNEPDEWPSNSPTAPSETSSTTSTPTTQPGQTLSPSPPAQSPFQRMLAAADTAISAGRHAEARVTLNRALHDPTTSDRDAESLRAKLADLHRAMLFSPAVTPGDPLVDTYAIQPGDRLIKVVQAHDLKVDWRFIQRVNAMSDPGRLRVGQKIKIVKGPFHAVVHKSDHRLDLYADMTDPEGHRLFIRSFPVGLGEQNSTPLGKWIVRPQSKLINPHWVNPRTGERFAADDPKNPIGEYWLGLTGIDSTTEVLSGYGIHGTIEPNTIGRDASMGCIRMLADDIALLYELLAEQASTVEIKP